MVDPGVTSMPKYPAGLGWLQIRVLDCLEGDDWALSVAEIATEIYRAEGDWPDDSEVRSVYQCLKRLEKRGIVKGWKTWIREIGVITVWRSRIDPLRQVFDPGG